MSPRFFIDRPVFSWVIALAILFAGFLAMRSLPIEQYPTIAPPSLTISAFYPGADASVLANNVTQPIEQELNGVEGFQYMSSSSQSNGSASISVTFRTGTDINVALMEVQNRLRRVEARLPEEVRRQGVQDTKKTKGTKHEGPKDEGKQSPGRAPRRPAARKTTAKKTTTTRKKTSAKR